MTVQYRPVPNLAQDEVVHDFGLALAAARTKKGNSLRDIARKIGLSKDRLRELEEGLLCPDAACFARLSKIFPAIDHYGPRLTEARQRATRVAANAPRAEAAPALPKQTLPLLGASAVVLHVPTPAPPPAPPSPKVRPSSAPLTTPLADKLAAVVVEHKKAAAPPPPPPDQERFGQWLRRAREAQGMTQRALSRRMGVDNSTVTSWESNRFPVPPARVEELKKLFPSLVNAPPPSLEDKAFYRPSAARGEAMRAAFAGKAKAASPAEDEKAAPVRAGRFGASPRTVTLERLPNGAARPAFATVLAAERAREELSPGALARLLGVDRKSIVNWEGAVLAPSQTSYDKLVLLFPALQRAAAPGKQDTIVWVDPRPTPSSPPPPALTLPVMLGPTTPAPAPSSSPPASAPAPSPKATPMPPSASSPSSFANALSFLTKMQAMKKSKDLALFVGLLQTMRDEEVKPTEVLALLETL